MPYTIHIQTHDFDVGEEHKQLRQDSPAIGAIVTFTGLVREFVDKNNPQQNQTNAALFLEHYPSMTEKVLSSIIDQAEQRWQITHTRIIHRIGHLPLSEQIVFVGVNSPHRNDAFSAARFIMDCLKTDAPFWKKEIGPSGEKWVDVKESDIVAKKTWLK